MNLNLIGPFVVNAPFGTEIAFAKGLKRIGHGVNAVDPNVESQFEVIDRDADATVVFKSCVGQEERLLRGLRGPVVVYQPDDARFAHIKRMMLDMRKHSDLFLSFDDYGAGVALTMGYRAAETLLLTADDELYCPSPMPIERDIDVSFIGSLGDPVAHASRRRMCEIVAEEARSRGWVFKYGTTQDIPAVLDTYRRSKVVLNHATDVGQVFGSGYGLQCRHFEVGMAGAAFLSNHLLGRPGHQLGFRSSKDIQNIPSDFRISWECPLFQVFDSAESLLFQLDRMLSESWDRDGRILHSQVMNAHLPDHRAAQLVSFIRRYS